MRIARVASMGALAALALGCAPSADVSGWEVAQKRGGGERMRSFPELPVVLPPARPVAPPGPEAPPAPPSTSGMAAVTAGRLDEGSLFRRGYSAPTP